MVFTTSNDPTGEREQRTHKDTLLTIDIDLNFSESRKKMLKSIETLLTISTHSHIHKCKHYNNNKKIHHTPN